MINIHITQSGAMDDREKTTSCDRGCPIDTETDTALQKIDLRHELTLQQLASAAPEDLTGVFDEAGLNNADRIRVRAAIHWEQRQQQHRQSKQTKTVRYAVPCFACFMNGDLPCTHPHVVGDFAAT